MRVLRYDDVVDVDIRWVADCERIVRVMKTAGFDISMRDAQRMWEEYSDGLCAGWIMLPESDEDIFLTLTVEVDWP